MMTVKMDLIGDGDNGGNEKIITLILNKNIHLKKIIMNIDTLCFRMAITS